MYVKTWRLKKGEGVCSKGTTYRTLIRSMLPSNIVAAHNQGQNKCNSQNPWLVYMVHTCLQIIADELELRPYVFYNLFLWLPARRLRRSMHYCHHLSVVTCV